VTPTLSLVIVVFLAILTQAISGSGLALVSMPLLVGIFDPLTAASLVALMALTTQAIMLFRYRRSVQLRRLWRLILSSALGIPLGVYALSQLDKQIILTALGVLLVSYALYSLLVPTLPEIKHPAWAYGFGFASGLLGGAYNTGGPPFVIYGMSQRWETAEFKGNLQVLLMVNSSLVVLTHIVAGHYTRDVLTYYAVSLPVIVVAALTGFWLDRFIDVTLFRKIVLVVLLIIGVRMLLGG
jgi:uncharacterized protein